MYSEKVLMLLKSIGAEELDLIEIKYKGTSIKGIIMPNNTKNQDSLILKLSSGYNVGLDIEFIKEMKLIRKNEKRSTSNKDEQQTQDYPQNTFKDNTEYVSILGCGGTIASKVEYLTGAAFPSFSPNELLKDFPELSYHSPIKSKLLFSLLSEDMQVEHWKIMANEIYNEAKNNECKGIVLMHGTDTMAFTASALSFMIKNLPFPVVLVGAQRSSDRGSSDNKLNLLSAILTAESEIAEVLVCMHHDLNDKYCALHYGTRVRKMHTSRRDAFKSINTQPLALVDYGKKEIKFNYENYNKKSQNLRSKVELKSDLNDNVALIYTHPGIKKKLFKFLSSYDGVVIAGTGLGHLPVNPFNDKFGVSLLQEVKELISSGIPVVMAPQTIYGRINMNVYSTGRILIEAGVIGNLCDWTPETAMVKLMWVLGQKEYKGNMKKIKEVMETNITHEITERSEI
ncbi:MAG: Glu-tRNA(Gln) amidotransferase subunit GatD [Candidatus Micrarchaeota archaeon]|nr:Glu-tRNA(Gln) amidotransferase subunit GatD [Candidatus Micrarchaeota archaeon]